LYVFLFAFLFLLFDFASSILGLRTNIIRYLVAATTLWSGLSYVFSKDAVKILSKEEVQKRIARAAAAKKGSS
jgi:cardiolipin synthase